MEKIKAFVSLFLTSETTGRPRHFFKLSHYEHAEYESVWVAYTSHKNPRDNAKKLCEAFFVIHVGNKFRIASHVSYSNYIENIHMRTQDFRWIWQRGRPGLDFGSLGKLIAIERILEPDKGDKQSTELYLAES